MLNRARTPIRPRSPWRWKTATAVLFFEIAFESAATHLAKHLLLSRANELDSIAPARGGLGLGSACSLAAADSNAIFEERDGGSRSSSAMASSRIGVRARFTWLPSARQNPFGFEAPDVTPRREAAVQVGRNSSDSIKIWTRRLPLAFRTTYQFRPSLYLTAALVCGLAHRFAKQGSSMRSCWAIA